MTDALPPLGLGMERRERGLMARPPRPPGETFLPSSLHALVTLISFGILLRRVLDSLTMAQSAAFAILIMAHFGIA